MSEAVIKKSPSSVISTKSFYSKPAVKISLPVKRELPKMKNIQQKSRSSTKSKKKGGGLKVFGLINKGVGHKIFKPRPIVKKTQKSPTVKNIVKILKSGSNDIEKRAAEGISAQQILRIQNIMKNLKNPIEMARPLSVNFNEVKKAVPRQIVQEECEYQDPPGKKKLLKSKHNFNNKYRVTDKISATFCKGKISFIANKDDKEFKLHDDFENKDEQIEIDGIINRLQDSQNKILPSNVDIPIPIRSEPNEISSYENLIPYKTSDPIVIEQQQNMLDFLVCNNICTDDNIKIFITEPENHKDEASKILNDLIVITESEDTEMYIEESCNVAESERIPQMLSPTRHLNNLTSSLQIVGETNQSQEVLAIQNDENQDKIFPIFKKGFTAPAEDSQLVKQTNKTKWKPSGSDQLQIDAGQKQFGAKECVECGFIYSVCIFYYFFLVLS